MKINLRVPKFKTLGMVTLLFAMSACEKEGALKQEVSELNASSATNKAVPEFSKTDASKSVAIIDARVRSINKSSCLKELVLVDFCPNKSGQIPLTFTYQGTKFTDTGTGFDLKANDGIFTSVNTFKHSSKVPYNKDTMIRSVIENSIVHESFLYLDKLNKYLESYSLSNNDPSRTGPVLLIRCKYEWVCGCWNTCCGFVFTDCEFEFGLG